MKCLFSVFLSMFAVAAQAELELSGIAAGKSSPGVAELVATVSGTGDVFAVYAPARNASYRSVRDRYVKEGLLAMWDAVDNMGTGGHDAGATTWRDLTGRHLDMTFTAPPTVGGTYYDLSAGGCGVAAPDIAEAIAAGAATVEIVCTVQSIRNDVTVFACVDGTDQAAGNRIAWVRSNNAWQGTAVLGAIEYKAKAYVASQNIDGATGVPRNYAFLYTPAECVVATNGAWAVTVQSANVNPTPANGWFSIGQRISMGGVSTGISDIRIHSVRVYNRYLTDAERLQNYAADRARFFTPPAVDLDAPDASAETALAGTVAAPFAGARDYYVQDGLIALWDGEDNQGTGAHVADATTWKDLTGNHADMVFSTPPAVGARFFDVSKGGGCIKACADIAAAIQAKNATIEIVCDVRTLVDAGTLFSLVDGTGTDAGNRLVWVMNGAYGSNHGGVVGTIDYLTNGSTTPYPSYDNVTNAVRGYAFTFASDCRVYRNGASTPGATKICHNVAGNASTACFSIGQRHSQGGKSGMIADMKVYCVRVYDRVLSADEIAANHAADEKRFFGTASAWPLGSFLVKHADGTSTACTGGKGVFRLAGLRPDSTVYTARLFTTNATPATTGAVTFESAAERPAATWFESLDSHLISKDRQKGSVISLAFAPNGRVPVVETRYRILGGEGHTVFGQNNDTWGSYVGLFPEGGALKYRYRIGDEGAYAALDAAELGGVHELTFNGPEGTVLNGRVLGPPAGKRDTGTDDWRLFGRWIGSNYRYNEVSNVRVWSFRLWADGAPVRDLVPAMFSHGRAGMFDRVSRTMLANLGSVPFTPGAELPPPEVADAKVCGKSLSLKLVRTGTAASDVYLVSGPTHGGAVLANWAHGEKLAVGFAEGQSELEVQDRGALASGARYVRFLSVQDGWSASVYLPQTPVVRGCVVIVR